MDGSYAIALFGILMFPTACAPDAGAGREVQQGPDAGAGGQKQTNPQQDAGADEAQPVWPGGATSQTDGSTTLDGTTSQTDGPTTLDAGTPELLAQQVKVDTDLRNHPEILWYPTFDDIAEARKDWSSSPYSTYDDRDGLDGPKLFVVDAPEFGMKAFRSESMSLNPYTKVGTDGSTILNFRKYFNINTKESYTGTALGSVPLNDLFARYCVMLENDVWTGMTDLGVKLGGMGGRADGQGTSGGGPFWHSKVDSMGRIRLTTYWYGVDLTQYGYGGDWIQGKYLLPDTWHCLEQHLKVNSMNPDGTPVADAILEAWFDDELAYSRKDFVIHEKMPTETFPIEINQFHLQIFHGGSATPTTPIHYRTTGVAVAKKRIGAPKRMPGI